MRAHPHGVRLHAGPIVDCHQELILTRQTTAYQCCFWLACGAAPAVQNGAPKPFVHLVHLDYRRPRAAPPGTASSGLRCALRHCQVWAPASAVLAVVLIRLPVVALTRHGLAPSSSSWALLAVAWPSATVLAVERPLSFSLRAAFPCTARLAVAAEPNEDGEQVRRDPPPAHPHSSAGPHHPISVATVRPHSSGVPSRRFALAHSCSGAFHTVSGPAAPPPFPCLFSFSYAMCRCQFSACAFVRAYQPPKVHHLLVSVLF
jgi:hypothetical protein